ncbi:SMP-30/gluconolactonase/LRE family protein [Gluconacetobacter takamatsuzukensis]|uniref:SMP-30/gluconolactonase/LRE family protein n=1 Tax=Gluconacetobacter takamatsuzukensis TaxID=1286190 RepID=A0A7W4KES1_9PROT|nr:SMP-30/gluconolactonase/LRE family protein [Gluconacetobacter takamatsuzukensis]MBB2205639.1 SMP-30/gluconolactonase/LRE family protein [Gluconacetobacter takamatsuzukensis]
MHATRRAFLARFLSAGAGGLVGARALAAPPLPAPPGVTTQPPRGWAGRGPGVFLPDPDVIALDASFGDLVFSGTAIQRVLSGCGWLEGPAWLGEARILLLSDTIRSQQYRLVPPDEDGPGARSVFRQESYHSNGNTLDGEGRIITCEHDMRRVIRWEHDGSCTVLADRCDGRPLNSPNDVVVHPGDGGIWFTDPAYGDTLVEGHPDAPGVGTNPTGRIRWQLGSEITTQFAAHERQPDHTFRIDARTGAVEAVLSQEDVASPNGLCFSPDLTKLYVVSSAPDPGQVGARGTNVIHVFDMVAGRPRNRRVFADMMLDGQKAMPDGLRADVFGNLWCGATGPLGVAGVFCYSPAGRLIGRIRLPDRCSNLTFGGPKRNELYMCCGPELYRLRLETQGAGLS